MVYKYIVSTTLLAGNCFSQGYEHDELCLLPAADNVARDAALDTNHYQPSRGLLVAKSSYVSALVYRMHIVRDVMVTAKKNNYTSVTIL